RVVLRGGSGRDARDPVQMLPSKLSERLPAAGWCLVLYKLLPSRPYQGTRESDRSRDFDRSVTHPQLHGTRFGRLPSLPTQAFPGSSRRLRPLPAAPQLPASGIHLRHKLAPESGHARPARVLWRRDRVAQFAPSVLPAYLFPRFNSRANQDLTSCSNASLNSSTNAAQLRDHFTGTRCFSSSNQFSTTLICVGANSSCSLALIIRKRCPSGDTE